MAKGGQKKKDSAAADRAGAPSLLSAAYSAYERGDVVRAREAARRALLFESTEPELAAARKLSPILFPEVTPARGVREVASELLSRTEVPRQPYLFVLVGAALIVLMILLALART